MRWAMPCASMIVTPAGRRRPLEHVAHGQERLQRVALRAAGRRDIRFAARHPDGVVEDRLDGCRVDPVRVVLDDDLVRFDDHRDGGGNLGLLAGVERVVEQLLGHDQWPVVGRVAGLVLEFTLAAELHGRETPKATRVSFGSGLQTTGPGLAAICKNGGSPTVFLACWIAAEPPSTFRAKPAASAPSIMSRLVQLPFVSLPLLGRCIRPIPACSLGLPESHSAAPDLRWHAVEAKTTAPPAQCEGRDRAPAAALRTLQVRPRAEVETGLKIAPSCAVGNDWLTW